MPAASVASTKRPRVVAEEVIGRALHAEGPEGHHLDALPAERPLRLEHVLHRSSRCRRRRRGRDRRRRPRRRTAAPVFQPGDSRPDPRRDVLEAAVAQVAIEQVRTEVGDEDVGPAVAVQVGDRDALAPSPLAADAGRVRHVPEGAVGHPFVERVPASLDDRGAVQRPAVHDVDVEAAVAVEVEEGGAAAEGVEQVILAGPPGKQDAGDAGLGRDVDELEGAGRARRAGGSGARGTREQSQSEDQRGARCSRASPMIARTSGSVYFAGFIRSATTACTLFHSASRAGVLRRRGPSRRSRATIRAAAAFAAFVTITKPSS